MKRRRDWAAIRGVVAKDWRAVSRSKAVTIPMVAVPVLLLVILPLAVGLGARAASGGGGAQVAQFLQKVPAGLAKPILDRPEHERLLLLVNGYLLSPLFLIVPLMVASVLAADAFAGEKERRTLEGLLHLPVADRDLFEAKVLAAWVPAVAVSWVGFIAYCAVSNAVGWSVMHRLFLPTKLWGVLVLWLAPAVATLGMAVMVRVSARVGTTQEANQLGGAVVLPLIFLTMGQATGLLLVTLPIAVGVGVVIWTIAIVLLRGGARRFSRDRLAAKV